MKYLLVSILVNLCFSVQVFAVQSTSASQWGITFHFAHPSEIGQFANGDYWVQGPVVITRITPDFDGKNNGWEVNPVYTGNHGFQDQCYGGDSFNPGLVPALPYSAAPGQSIVKTTPSKETLVGNAYRPCLNTAAVLTVVAGIPVNNGSTLFRPPYVGTAKPLYSVSDLRHYLLPSLEPVEATPSLESIKKTFQRVQLDHKGGGTGRALRPKANMPDYGADMARNEADAALRLMLNDSFEAKKDALIAFVQTGIDLHAMVQSGQYWPRGGGEQPGHTLPYVFAAVVLDNQAMKKKIKEISEAELLYNDYANQYGEKNRVLWGDKKSWSERQYWGRFVLESGSKTLADPYGYIDGGYHPGGGYQYCCTSMPWKGLTLAFHLMPVMKRVWNNPKIFDYADRWVNFGAWTQPDPCAPHDGIWANYGVTYGPDPSNPGKCIKDTNPADGIGRFPGLHGSNRDTGHRATAFQNNMWLAYRKLGASPSFLVPLLLSEDK
jgi:hypothetical protein